MSSIVNKYRKCNIPYPYNFIYSGKLKSLSLPDVKNPEGEFYRVQKLILGTRAKHNSVWLQVVNIIFAKVVGNHLVMVVLVHRLYHLLIMVRWSYAKCYQKFF
nr:WD-40 repeat-containing protein MSI1-like [Ipomoea batatas]